MSAPDGTEINPHLHDINSMDFTVDGETYKLNGVPKAEETDQNKFLKGDGTWASTSSLPAVTANDNGKVLQVVGGEWSKGNEKLDKEYEVDYGFFPFNISGIPAVFSGNYIWTDSDDYYCSMGRKQYVLDKSTLTWIKKTWTSLTSFYGSDIWTDGDNTYYSSGSTQKVLSKTANSATWSTKNWLGLTNFNGSNVWSDGSTFYYSSGSTQYVLDKSTSTWSTKNWSGLTSFNGSYVWTDGDNIYYSKTGSQYVLDKTTSTWSEKTWTGLTSFYGMNVWTDGENIYCSEGATQYVLNKSTSTWYQKAWTGLTYFSAGSIWTYEDSVYFSSSEHYVLNKDTSEWIIKDWASPLGYEGKNVWNDGNTVYYSDSDKQYVFNKATSAWDVKNWNGWTTMLTGEYIWSDGNNIYYSSNSLHYALDRSTSTWNEKTWTGLARFSSTDIWTDGTNTYYSSGYTHYVLDKATSTWNTKTWTGLEDFYASNIWTDGTDIYYSSSTDHYVLDKSTSTWTRKTWSGLESFDAEDIWACGSEIYCYSSPNQYVLDKATSTWSIKILKNAPVDDLELENIWTDGDNTYYSKLEERTYKIRSNGVPSVLIGTNGMYGPVPCDEFPGILPPVIAADEGKMLKVVNGQWVVVESPDGKIGNVPANKNLQGEVDELNSKVASSLDIVLTNYSDVESKLLELAGTMNAGESKLVRIVYTGTEVLPMLHNYRYMGYLKKSYSGNFFTWDATSYSGHDIHFARDNSSWHIYSLNSKIENKIFTNIYSDYIEAQGSKTYTLPSNSTAALLFGNDGNGKVYVHAVSMRSNTEIGTTQISSQSPLSFMASGMSFTIYTSSATRIKVIMF